jgi:hypothetical protein
MLHNYEYIKYYIQRKQWARVRVRGERAVQLVRLRSLWKRIPVALTNLAG